MGCDIHGVLEYREEGTGLWIGLHDYQMIDQKGYDFFIRNDRRIPGDPETHVTGFAKLLRRNYELFASLAGVRGSGPEPKGIPRDASTLTRFLIGRWGEDGHSHSYGTIRELGVTVMSHLDPTKVLATEDRAQWLADIFCTGIYVHEHQSPEWMDQFRFVFWFDN